MQRILSQKLTENGQVFPSPRPGERMLEDPPCLMWRKEEGVAKYRATILDEQGKTVWAGNTQKNYIVPERALGPGEYQWNIEAMQGAEAVAQRGWQRFSIAPEAVVFLRPNARDVFAAVPDVRPRHLFFAQDIEKLVQERPQAMETLCRNIDLAIREGTPQPPIYHRQEDALPPREYFGRHRDFCDRNLVACALGHALLGDARAAAQAKETLLTICDWNSEGPCSLEGPWNDEVGLSHARCLPAVFDLCYDLLDEKQRVFVARTVAAYARQCERRLHRLDFCANPGDSHAGRLPAYLGEAAMVLKGTGVEREETLISWLEYAIEIYGGIFPYFGGPDGGWAEGMFYAGSYTKWFLPFFSAVERFSGVSFLKRPCWQRLIRFFQHFCPPGWENHPFGDGYWCLSDDAEWPGFLAQNPYHIYAERFGGPLTRKWSREAQRQEIFKLHLLDVFLPEGEPTPDSLAGKEERACAFPDAGYISLHTNPACPEGELALLARSSRFGSQSHGHADQGSFALLCGGVALISPSGYFGRQYGTRHHIEWTNSSAAHNTILVNGEGQKTFSCFATGEICGAWDEGGQLRAQIDPSGAYEHVQKWIRSFTLHEGELLVEDHIELDAPGEISWLLHALSRPQIVGNAMHLARRGVQLRIVPEKGGLHAPQIADQFSVDLNEGEPEQYHVRMPEQYHMQWKTPRAQTHDIAVRFLVCREQ